ncbi:MAG: hypothetical protein ACFCD0_19665 [Gemmataceae bacterium]
MHLGKLSHSVFVAMLPVVVTSAPSDTTAKERPTLEEQLKKITPGSSLGPGGPRPISGTQSYYAYKFDAVNLKGKRTVGLLATASPKHGGVTYPRLKTGEIIPLFGRLYVYDGAALIRLSPKRIPKGLSLKSDSQVCPLHRNNGGSCRVGYRNQKGEYQSRSLWVVLIEGPTKNRMEPVAHIKLDDFRATATVVRLGTVLTFGQTEVRVRNIVPADPSKKILGWVELGVRTKNVK